MDNNENKNELYEEVEESIVEESEEEFFVPEEHEAEDESSGEKTKNPLALWITAICVPILLFIAMLIILPYIKTGETAPVYKDYSITVIDGTGLPVANVIVKFTTPDGEVKTRVTDKDGLAELKNVLADTYTVNVERGLSDAVILTSNYTLTDEVNQVYCVVRNEKSTMEIYGDLPDGTYASTISTGSYFIPCVAGQRSFFVFTTNTSGVYKISIKSNNPAAKVGYYGIPMFVQSHHCADGEYDGKSFDLIIQDSATPYVLGVDSDENANINIVIERIGDPPFDPQFAPWTDVLPTENFIEFEIPAGSVLTDLDITDPTLSVTLGDDGYYYTTDGSLVYIRINSVGTSNYLDVPITLIAGLVDNNIGTNFGGYVYDEGGNFVGKYSYNNMIQAYMEHCDSNGVYPLTQEMAEAIKTHGDSSGWWNPGAANYLFSSVSEVEKNAWLFLCCTAK